MRVLDRLAKKPMLSLEPVDFRGGKGAEGTSYLLSLVMDRIEEENKHLTQAQLAQISLHASFCHPVILTRGLRQVGERNSIITRGLQLPPLHTESILCPMDTPYLITNGKLRE